MMDPILVIGGGAVAVGLAVAAAIVWFDLGATTRFSAGQRLWLTVTMASGVLGLAVKVLMVAGFVAVGLPSPAPVARPPAPTAPEVVAWGQSWEALPEQVPGPPVPNPALIALGERLFHEPRLSADGTIACAGCHDVRGGAGSDGRAVAQGIRGQLGSRNSPSVFNAAFQAVQFWDGRARSLEAQAQGPLLNPVEMGNASLADVAQRLMADADYRAAFAAAFGDRAPIAGSRIAGAIAAYERTLVTADAPFDRFVRGDQAALTPQQVQGMALFQSVGCTVCHAGPGFSRASRLSPERGASALRRFPVYDTPSIATYHLGDDHGAAPGNRPGVWRIPSLRNVALTAPYFHNGAVTSLDEAVRVMAAAQLGLVISNQPATAPVITWDPLTRRIGRRVPGSISQADVQAITAFLRALSSERLAARPAFQPKSTTTISGGTPRRTGAMEQPSPPETMR
jgi:cytochrome c peroxidase